VQQATVVNYSAQNVVVWSYATDPVAFLPYRPVQLYELGAAETLSANNQSCRNVVPLRPKALYERVVFEICEQIERQTDMQTHGHEDCNISHSCQ